MIDQEARDLAVASARIADEFHGSDILVLHVGDVLSLTEYFVIVAASNKRLVDAMTDQIESAVRDQTGRSPIRVEGAREHQWVLIDYGDVIVHVFLTEVRDFYEIERLYSDVPKVDWADASTPATAD
ncbi:MAG: ribosome silencing factor [Ilumatobacteraceae bacterium]